MALVAITKVSPAGREAYRARLANALRRRLFPNTGLHLKTLAGRLGVTEETIGNWLAGRTEPAGYILMLLAAALADPLFWSEVAGPIGDALRERYEEQMTEERRRQLEAKAVLPLIAPTRAAE